MQIGKPLRTILIVPLELPVILDLWLYGLLNPRDFLGNPPQGLVRPLFFGTNRVRPTGKKVLGSPPLEFALLIIDFQSLRTRYDCRCVFLKRRANDRAQPKVRGPADGAPLHHLPSWSVARRFVSSSLNPSAGRHRPPERFGLRRAPAHGRSSRPCHDRGGPRPGDSGRCTSHF